MKRVCSVLFLVGLVVPLAAQVDYASLNGTVTDPSTAVMPGARVVALSNATGFRRETTTGAGGTYQMSGLAVGKYTVTISRDGFKAAQFKDVELAVGQPRTIDARLEVGSVAEAVEVSSTLETLNRTSAEVGGLIEVGADQGDPSQRPQLGQPDAAGARRGQLQRRLAAQHSLQRPLH